MLVVIKYTPKSNMEEDQFRMKKIIDESLVESEEIENGQVDQFLTDGDFELLSKWKKEDWDRIQIRNAEVEKELYGKAVKRHSGRILEISDEKQLAAEFIIAEKNVTAAQRERYKVNYKHARIVAVVNQAEVDQLALEAGLTADQIVDLSKDILQPIADARGMTVEDLANDIIVTAKLWEAAIDSFTTLIEAVRVRAFDLIKAKKFNAVALLNEEAAKIGNDTEGLSPEDTLTTVKAQVAELLARHTL